MPCGDTARGQALHALHLRDLIIVRRFRVRLSGAVDGALFRHQPAQPGFIRGAGPAYRARPAMLVNVEAPISSVAEAILPPEISAGNTLNYGSVLLMAGNGTISFTIVGKSIAGFDAMLATSSHWI